MILGVLGLVDDLGDTILEPKSLADLVAGSICCVALPDEDVDHPPNNLAAAVLHLVRRVAPFPSSKLIRRLAAAQTKLVLRPGLDEGPRPWA